jgi:hypothetical protein
MGMLTPLNGLSPKYLFYLMTSEGYKDFIAALEVLKLLPVSSPSPVSGSFFTAALLLL